MPSRPVHWSEGMFLRPQHFQAADRHARQSLTISEDWYHPFNWGVRRVEFDRDAIANYAVVLRACEARFKDGTKLSVPDDSTADPAELRAALTGSGSVMVYLAVPALQPGRANVEETPTADGPRYSIEDQEAERREHRRRGVVDPGPAHPLPTAPLDPGPHRVRGPCPWRASSARRNSRRRPRSTSIMSPPCSRSTAGRRSGRTCSRSTIRSAPRSINWPRRSSIAASPSTARSPATPNGCSSSRSSTAPSPRSRRSPSSAA